MKHLAITEKVLLALIACSLITLTTAIVYIDYLEKDNARQRQALDEYLIRVDRALSLTQVRLD